MDDELEVLKREGPFALATDGFHLYLGAWGGVVPDVQDELAETLFENLGTNWWNYSEATEVEGWDND